MIDFVMKPQNTFIHVYVQIYKLEQNKFYFSFFCLCVKNLPKMFKNGIYGNIVEST